MIVTLKPLIEKAMKPDNEKPRSCVEQYKPLQKAINETKARYGDARQFMITFNKNIQPLVAANIERAYLGTAPTLTLVRNSYSNNVLIMWIMAQLENLNDFIGVNQKMNINQMEELAQIIAIDYHFLKVTELHLFLHRLKAGRYGEFFGNIDPILITKALRTFAAERINEITVYERVRQNKKMQLQHDEWAKKSISRQEYERIKKQDKSTK